MYSFHTLRTKKASNYCEMFRQALFFCNFVKKGLFTLIVEQFL